MRKNNQSTNSTVSNRTERQFYMWPMEQLDSFLFTVLKVKSIAVRSHELLSEIIYKPHEPMAVNLRYRETRGL